ncbi:MAG: hypothetical protein ABI823_11945 [Bryobacteraceae bacterium]
MIPFIATVRVRRPRGRGVHLWIPLGILWLALLPLVLVLLPFLAVACWVARISAVRTVSALWSVLSSLKGLDLDIMQRDCGVAVRLL